MDALGGSLEAIVAAKCGIIKEGRPVRNSGVLTGTNEANIDLRLNSVVCNFTRAACCHCWAAVVVRMTINDLMRWGLRTFKKRDPGVEVSLQGLRGFGVDQLARGALMKRTRQKARMGRTGLERPFERLLATMRRSRRERRRSGFPMDMSRRTLNQ